MLIINSMIKRYKLFRIYPKLCEFFYIIWNRVYFRLLGIRFGKRFRVYNKIYIICRGNIHIGDDFIFSSGNGINPICRNIRGALYTMTDEAQIEIGDRVGISSSCILARKRIIIGNDVNIGGDCLIMDNDSHPHDYVKRRRTYEQNNDCNSFFASIPTSPIIIDDDVWIGARCHILKGVHIGARSIIAAGSIVTNDIPADVIAGGNPCKIIRKI